MARVYDADALVQLPRCSSVEAHVLAQELLTVADSLEKPPEGAGVAAPPAVEAAAPEPAASPVTLPVKIGKSRERLRQADHGLTRLLQPQVVPPAVKKAADAAVDNAWSATFDWLNGWCKLPADRFPEKERALHLFALCFYEGLTFTLRRYKIEWNDSQKRLAAIAREEHEQTFEDLGGAVFLNHLQQTQAHYGEVLGITAPKTSPAQDSAVGVKRDALLAAIRDYVTKVVAHVEPDEPNTRELADTLLRPLTEWESQSSSGTTGTAEATEPPAETAPEPPAGTAPPSHPEPGEPDA